MGFKSEENVCSVSGVSSPEDRMLPMLGVAGFVHGV